MKIPDPPPRPGRSSSSSAGRFPGDQVQKAECAIRVQKPLRFAYKIEWIFEKMRKSAPNSLENKDSNGRDPRFPLFALGPLGNGPGRRGLPPRAAARMRNSSQYGTKRIPPKGADEEDPPLRARTKRIPLGGLRCLLDKRATTASPDELSLLPGSHAPLRWSPYCDP